MSKKIEDPGPPDPLAPSAQESSAPRAEHPVEEWLSWTERLRALAQNGSAYTVDPYDRERYQELNDLAQKMQAAALGVAPSLIADRFELHGGYPTPKVEVRAGVLDGDRILLVQEESDRRWALPGGWADQQVSPAGNAEKEVAEETGLTVTAVKLVAVRDHRADTYRPKRLEHVFRLLFLCERQSGELQTSLETVNVDYFPVTALPPLSVGRTAQLDIELLLQHSQNRGLPAWFD